MLIQRNKFSCHPRHQILMSRCNKPTLPSAGEQMGLIITLTTFKERHMLIKCRSHSPERGLSRERAQLQLVNTCCSVSCPRFSPANLAGSYIIEETAALKLTAACFQRWQLFLLSPPAAHCLTSPHRTSARLSQHATLPMRHDFHRPLQIWQRLGVTC